MGEKNSSSFYEGNSTNKDMELNHVLGIVGRFTWLMENDETATRKSEGDRS